ncbi:MAG: hypothetical protein DCC55_21870, partial [Chloroflexi bacterium]
MKPHLGNVLVEYVTGVYTQTVPNWRGAGAIEPDKIHPARLSSGAGRRGLFAALILATALLGLLTFTLAYGQTPIGPCDPIDRNCDGDLNIIDF